MTKNIFNFMMDLMNCADSSRDNGAYKAYDAIRDSYSKMNDEDKAIIEKAFLEYTGDLQWKFEQIMESHIGKVLDVNY